MVKDKLIYEYVIESFDRNGDIYDVDHSETFPTNIPENADVALTRIIGNDLDLIKDRKYAYLTAGKLPETFEDGFGNKTNVRVPKRFHVEVERGK
tara:strand:+ start:412 stop:696 length:285 start_codon:yes stop_codon:yes gene_type:complete